MTNLTEQYRELEQDFFAYQKMLNEANKDLNKYCLENIKLKELLKRAKDVLEDEGDYMIVQEINQVLGE